MKTLIGLLALGFLLTHGQKTPHPAPQKVSRPVLIDPEYPALPLTPVSRPF